MGDQGHSRLEFVCNVDSDSSAITLGPRPSSRIQNDELASDKDDAYIEEAELEMKAAPWSVEIPTSVAPSGLSESRKPPQLGTLRVRAPVMEGTSFSREHQELMARSDKKTDGRCLEYKRRHRGHLTDKKRCGAELQSDVQAKLEAELGLLEAGSESTRKYERFLRKLEEENLDDGNVKRKRGRHDKVLDKITKEAEAEEAKEPWTNRKWGKNAGEKQYDRFLAKLEEEGHVQAAANSKTSMDNLQKEKGIKVDRTKFLKTTTSHNAFGARTKHDPFLAKVENEYAQHCSKDEKDSKQVFSDCYGRLKSKFRRDKNEYDVSMPTELTTLTDDVRFAKEIGAIGNHLPLHNRLDNDRLYRKLKKFENEKLIGDTSTDRERFLNKVKQFGEHDKNLKERGGYDQFMLKIQAAGMDRNDLLSDTELQQLWKKLGGDLSNACLTPSDFQKDYYQSGPFSLQMTYTLLFATSSTLHSVVFLFLTELRQAMQLYQLSIGLTILLLWCITGVSKLIGGIVGDLSSCRVGLLRKTGVIWMVAVVLLHLTSFHLPHQLHNFLLSVAFPCAFYAYGTTVPNIIAVTVAQLRHSNSSKDDTPTIKKPALRRSNSDVGAMMKGTLAASEIVPIGNDLSPTSLEPTKADAERTLFAVSSYSIEANGQVSIFYARCFLALALPASIAQILYFGVLDVVYNETGAHSNAIDEEAVSLTGAVFMLLSSTLLASSLIWFYTQARRYVPELPAVGEGKRHHNYNYETAVDYRLLARLLCISPSIIVLMMSVSAAIIGAITAVVIDAAFMEVSPHFRVFIIIMVSTSICLSLLIGIHLLDFKKRLVYKALQSKPKFQRQAYSALLVMMLVCVASAAAFFRAQLYTTLVVQSCQTHRRVIGSHYRIQPDIFAPAFELLASVLVVTVLTSGLQKHIKAGYRGDVSSPTVVQLSTYSMTSETDESNSSWLHPTRWLTFSLSLMVLSLFLIGIIELYRRRQDQLDDGIHIGESSTCGELMPTAFGWAWTVPAPFLLSVADVIFRTSIMEQLDAMPLFRKLPGTLAGIASLGDVIGFSVALSLSIALSDWFYKSSSYDLAILLLLISTGAAFVYGILKHAVQRLLIVS